MNIVMAMRSMLFICLLLAVIPANSSMAQDLVEMKLLQFGAGNTFRPGDPTGIEIELTSRLDSDQSVWIQWDHETPDGDIFAFGRSVLLSPGQPRSTWLYVPLPPDTNLQSTGRIRARDIEDDQPRDDIGRLQFQVMSSLPRLVPRDQSLIGVIGTDSAGLEAYEAESLFQNDIDIGGEGTTVSTLSDPSKLPDRWTGLRSFDSLIWTDGSAELSPSQEKALLEWIQRGGHLIIILPQSGNVWSLGSGEDGPLGAIMPSAPQPRDDVLMYKVLEDLVKHPPLPDLQQTIPAQIFRSEDGQFDAAPSADGWYPTWSLDGIGTVGVQRHHGKGQLTLLGVDVASKAIRDAALRITPGQATMTEHVPEGDLFWNPILARRIDTPPSQAIDQLKALNRINQKRPSQWLVDDTLILAEISDRKEFGSILMIGFLLFIIYWIFAIPLSWSILKTQKKPQLSWIIFVVNIAVFSIIAWVTVWFNRQNDTNVRHLTVLDHVHGEDQQHAVSWISLFSPGYGDYEVKLSEDETNVLLPWEAIDTGFGRFPDSRETIVDIDEHSNELTIPSRATTTRLRADWRGPLTESNWGDMLRMDNQSPVHVIRNSDGDAIGLRGTVESLLPDTMVNGQIILVDRAQPLPRSPEMLDGKSQLWVRQSHSGRMERKGWIWALAEELPPGGTIALNQLKLNDEENDLESSIRIQYGSHSRNLGGGFEAMTHSDRLQALQALSTYHQLQPPSWITVEAQRGQIGRNWSILKREIGHDLDLSHWMSRPVLIITGFLEESELPLPLLVNGDLELQSEGLVMVRWIMPLPEE
ncbi:MAG: hypothetical protein CMJ40_11365 [Phycisphaerae bacterium]|nr:hypothetical protein [Phycisphaerae bacterium]|tara:strand:+ start:1462 stop:3888 length:2427 start_codon:yes stop_codon:yes gene_type:complete